MTPMRRHLAVLLALLAAFLAAPGAAHASLGDSVLANFNSPRAQGYTKAVQTVPGTVTVTGAYRNVAPYVGVSMFTVLYPNERCDPANALPIGPIPVFTRDSVRVAFLPPTTVQASYLNGGDVDLGAQYFSVSIRRGDTAGDIDGDNVTGSTDVVAVAGSPTVGLIQCQRLAVQVNLP